MTFATYAIKTSKGRAYHEIEDVQDAFLYDRQKIIHSSAFRRLEYKTQVFVNHVGDHYRTRLTHTLEVCQISRMIARKLNLNEDLAESVALAHDLGHPPFGHAGEEGLNKAALKYGGFDHNAHTLRVLSEIEQRSLNYKGLNLTHEAIDGIAKHNGLITDKSHHKLKNVCETMGIVLNQWPSLEAQCAAEADDIAYINHDIDDGIRANMFLIEELIELPIINKILPPLLKPKVNIDMIRKDFILELSKYMINDLVTYSLYHIKMLHITSTEDVKNAKSKIITFSEEVEEAKNQIKQFLMQRVYRHYKVNRMSAKCKDLLQQLFTRYILYPECLPTTWQEKIKGDVASVVIDYIAGMTDRFAIEEYKRLFDPEFI